MRGPNTGEGLRLSPVPQVWKRRVKAAEKERSVKGGETGRVAAWILIGESISKKEWAIVSDDADRTAGVTTESLFNKHLAYRCACPAGRKDFCNLVEVVSQIHLPKQHFLPVNIGYHA